MRAYELYALLQALDEDDELLIDVNGTLFDLAAAHIFEFADGRARGVLVAGEKPLDLYLPE